MFDVAAHAYAHRGLWGGDVPENSLAAFAAAARAGAGVELDARVTKDGGIVVFHDATMQRLCGDPARIGQTAFDDIQLRRLGDGSPIPPLGAALEAAGGRPVLVEIKIDRYAGAAEVDRGAVLAVMGLLQRAPCPVAAMSFDETAVRMLAASSGAWPVGQLIEPLADLPAEVACAKAARAMAAGATYLAPHLSSLPAIAAAFPGIPLVTWTVWTPNDLAVARLHNAAPIFERISPALALGGKPAI